MSATQVRNFVFTINNPIEQDLVDLEDLKAKYVVWGEEIGKEGTNHLQGYAEMKSGVRFSTLKNKLPRAHIEARKGTAKQAIDYCKKDGKWHELGEASEQGKRSDLKKVADTIKESGIHAAITESPEMYIKFHRGMKELDKHYKTEIREKIAPLVIWAYGEAGTGKSKWAHEEFPGAWWSADNLKWFDGYMGQRVAIIDDFRHEMCSFQFLLRLLDRYPLRVPIKGDFVDWIPEVIVITAPRPPRQSVATMENIDQLTRRIGKILYFECADKAATEVDG